MGCIHVMAERSMQAMQTARVETLGSYSLAALLEPLEVSLAE